MNDSEFLHLLRSGDKAAFSKLVEAYKKPVLNICFRFLLNREDAEDVAQDVFVEIYHSIASFRGDAHLGTWIHRVAVTRSLDEIRKRKRKKRIASFGETLGLDQISSWLAGTDRPDKSLEQADDLKNLEKALNQLPDNQRIALTLSKLDGCPTPKIAEIMQTSITAVDSLIYRAKQNLKTYLINQTPD